MADLKINLALKVEEGTSAAGHVMATKKPLYGDDLVQVLMLVQEKKISGIFVVVQDAEEAIFVNIIGDIDMKSIATISRQFDIPGLDAIEEVMP